MGLARPRRYALAIVGRHPSEFNVFHPDFVLARNEALNQWLNENPLVLGLVMIGVGLLIGGWGAYELSTGVTRSKRGVKVVGASALLLSGVRILVGVGALLFGVYKLIAG